MTPEAQQRLEAEVERQRQKHGTQPVSESPLPDRMLNVAELMPEIESSFVRIAEKARQFREEQRAPFAAAREKIPCPAHPGELLAKNFDETCAASFAAHEFRIVYAPCPLCDSEKDREKRRRFWSRRGIPSRVINATLDNFRVFGESADAQRVAVLACRGWLRRSGLFLLLLGSPGTGKGHLAASCLKAQGDGLFLTHADLLCDLRASYTTHTTRELIERWQDAELLVLDDFGVRSEGRDEETALYQVLSDRHDKRRPTIITTNKDKPEVREILGFRLVDRIRENLTEITMNWISYRTKKP